MFIFTVVLILILVIFAAILLTAFTDIDGALTGLVAFVIFLFLSFTSAAILYAHDENLEAKISENVIAEFGMQPVEDVSNLTVAEYNSLIKIGDNYYRGKKWQKYSLAVEK